MKPMTRMETRLRALCLGLAAMAWLGFAQVAAAQEPPAAADSAMTTPEPAADSLTPPAAPPAESNPNPQLYTKLLVKLDAQPQTVLREGPGDDYAIAGVFPKGTTFPVVTKTGDWYGVRLPDARTGWVHHSLCRELEDLSSLEFKPNPRLYRRTGTYVLGAYSGAYAYDRKSNSLVVGGRLGYYVFDRLQAEAGVAWTHVRRPAEIVETLFDLSLEAEDFHMLFYRLGMTYEILPGRQMVPFVTGGVGSTIMRGDSETSWDFGAGVALFLSKRTNVRWEVRDYQFDSGSKNARHHNNNVEFALGTSYLF